MAIKLNLLPEDYAVSGPVSAFIKFARPLNVILLGVFLVTALGMAAFFIISSLSLKKLNSENNNLKSQIQSLQAAQQQIVLLKDRLGKIQTVITQKDTINSFQNLLPFINSFSDSANLSEMTVSTLKTNLSAVFATNTDLSGFISRLQSQKSFSQVSFDSFSYSPASGYLVGVSFGNKASQ